MSLVVAQPRPTLSQRTARAVGPHRLVRLFVRGCATTAIVFGAPVDLRTLVPYGPPR